MTPATPAIDEKGLLPCPHCGSQLQHIESLALSFNPPRIYHEWHHGEDNGCWLRERLGLIIMTATDTNAEDEVAAWNRRAYLAATARPFKHCDGCDGHECTDRCKYPEPAADRDGDLRSALQVAREEIVVAIAFLGRDAGTDRIDRTIRGLIDRLVKADQQAQSALRSSLKASQEAEVVKATKTCPSCGGNGVNPEGIMRPDGLLADCEVCNGRGFVATPQPAPDTEEQP